MSATLVKDEGVTLEKDPDERRVWPFDWGTHGLADGVPIDTSAWLVQDTHPTAPDSALTVDAPSISADGRTTYGRVNAGTLEHKYRVINRIVTLETPAQTIDGVFYVRVRAKR